MEHEEDLNIPQLWQTPEQISSYFLHSLPLILPYNLHSKQKVLKKQFLTNLILMLVGRDLLPFISLSSEAICQYVPSLFEELQMREFVRGYILKPSLVSEQTYILLEGNAKRTDGMKSSLRKRTRASHEKCRKLVTFKNDSYYVFKEDSIALNFPTIKIQTFKIIIEQQMHRQINRILSKVFDLSIDQVIDKNLIKFTHKTILPRNEKINQNMLLIYVRQGEILCQGQNYKYLLCNGGIIFKKGQNSHKATIAQKDSIIIYFDSDSFGSLIQLMPSLQARLLNKQNELNQIRINCYKKQQRKQQIIQKFNIEFENNKKRFSKRKQIKTKNVVPEEFSNLIKIYALDQMVKGKARVQAQKRKRKNSQNIQLKNSRIKKIFSVRNRVEKRMIFSESDRKSIGATLSQTTDFFTPPHDTKLFHNFVDSEACRKQIKLAINKNRPTEKKNYLQDCSTLSRIIKSRAVSSRNQPTNLIQDDFSFRVEERRKKRKLRKSRSGKMIFTKV